VGGGDEGEQDNGEQIAQPKGLSGRGVCVDFGGIRAVNNVDIAVKPGEVIGLIGANGSGKTTLLNALTGFARISSGMVIMDGVDISKFSVQGRARLGLVRTFQAARLFNNLTVLDNLRVAFAGRGAHGKAAHTDALRILESMSLTKYRDIVAGNLSYGVQRQVSLARAVAAKPKYLLLDEPAAGLDEGETDSLIDSVRNVKDEIGCGVILIEHDLHMVKALCPQLQVLSQGSTIAVGSSSAVMTDVAVIDSYLGSGPGGR
jgi:branched-chain amino acid transport system ATP-binding protein